MPLYVYRRDDGSTLELQQSIHDDPLTVCPETGQPMRRVPQAFDSNRLGSRFHQAAKYAKRKTQSA